MSEYSKAPSPRARGSESRAKGTQNLGLRDKYCPFVSADCRAQQVGLHSSSNKIIIIILIIHRPKGSEVPGSQAGCLLGVGRVGTTEVMCPGFGWNQWDPFLNRMLRGLWAAQIAVTRNRYSGEFTSSSSSSSSYGQ